MRRELVKVPKSICVIRLSAIGDVCHTLSVIQSIQRNYPSCAITWVMGKTEAQLLGDIPGIQVVAFDKKQGFRGMREVWNKLSESHFDYLLHMQVALRASILTLGIRASTKIGFSWKRAKEGQWLFTNMKLPDSPAEHVMDNFALFAKQLGCSDIAPQWHIPLNKQDFDLVELASNPKYAVICPSASKDERNWLPERYAAVADYLSSKGLQVWLCGSPTNRERLFAEQIEALSKSPLKNMVGETNLKQLTAVIQKAVLVLAPDSGPVHIATTQSTPVIGLYAHSNPKRTGPYFSQNLVVSEYESIARERMNRTPEQLNWGTRFKGDNLMERISIESVISKVDIVLHEQSLSKV
ncbi:glycosyltransferase family 9 protein [Vibrio paucivorans]|uniref:Glycosyltransferase family 9 protein n=1 Tax=Vibrio paucivorans TaxID=2829489 RepID=A0A9X3HR08_9VIBR|nr:glycosyltransferase family 9 protein [Vibrio paucivorans]MCW8333609.1 glycosyltransferase family 9 protein [Vibrio paucivorans]